MAWVNTPGVENFRNQLNERFPRRDKRSDGTVGDLAHQSSPSSHNPDRTGYPEWADGDSKDEVRAFDGDANLNDPEVSTYELIQHLNKLPNVKSVIRYIIFDGYIYSSDTGFTREIYYGSDPHDTHFHITFQFTNSADENRTFNYRLFDLGDDMDQETFNTRMNAWAKTNGLQGGRSLGGTLDALVRVDKQGDDSLYNTSVIGRNAFNQSIPNPLAGDGTGKTEVWIVLRDLAKAVKEIQEQLATPQ